MCIIYVRVRFELPRAALPALNYLVDAGLEFVGRRSFEDRSESHHRGLSILPLFAFDVGGDEAHNVLHDLIFAAIC